MTFSRVASLLAVLLVCFAGLSAASAKGPNERQHTFYPYVEATSPRIHWGTLAPRIYPNQAPVGRLQAPPSVLVGPQPEPPTRFIPVPNRDRLFREPLPLPQLNAAPYPWWYR